MKVTALGHAGLKVETKHATLLLDPWFSPEGAFQASWFQYPDNAHLLTTSLFKPTAVVISHEHLDHIDPWFLSRVPSDVPVVVPRYPSPVLRHKIESAGPRTIIEAPQWEPVEVAPGTRVFFVSEPPMNHDSAIIVQADGHTLLDLNDARLFPVQLREIRQKVGGTVEVFSFQGAGASWYPMCYRYAPERAGELSRQKRMAKFAYCFRSMRVVEPVVGLPFAGPPAFLDPELFRHNSEMEEGIFPDQQQVADWLAKRRMHNTAVLLPGDSWDTDARRKHADRHWADFRLDDRWGYLEAYAARRRPDLGAVLARHPEPKESLWEPFKEYFRNLLSMSSYFNDRIGMRVGFEIRGPGGGRWAVDFRPQSRGVFEDIGECSYAYSFDSRWLPSILDGSTPWEDFFLSLRFSAHRDPDIYNDHLLGLLKFAEPDALEAVARFETAMDSDERITIHSEGRRYSVQRYCPHAGNDLLNTGEVLPGGILRCLAHHYEFDLNSGSCLNGNCSALIVEPLEEETVSAGSINPAP
ncbi:MAG: MBL fold metallo-hydrolase [Actinomycetota bacterium]